MRIRVASDLHLDRQRDDWTRVLNFALQGEWDVLAMPGDLCESDGLKRFLPEVATRAAGRPVVFVLGNHDHWGSDPVNAIITAKDVASGLPSFHVLEMESVEVLGRRFVGSTHWYKIPKVTYRDREWSDFYRIMGTEDWVHSRARESARFLASEVREGDVVLTHFLPYVGGIPARWVGDPTNRYFVHDVRPIVEGKGAALWVHGHTHSSMDYVLGTTRVTCNPYGYPNYPGEPNPGFYQMVVEP